MYVPTFSVSNRPIYIYTGNCKQHQKLTGWKLKVNFWTGGHHHDTENWYAHVFNMLLKHSGTQIVNANAAVTIKFQILSFCWNESSLFSYHLQTQGDNAAALLCLLVFWRFPSQEHGDNIQLSVAAPQVTTALSPSLVELCWMFISEMQPVSNCDRHHTGRQRKTPGKFVAVPLALLIKIPLLSVRLQLAELLNSFLKFYQRWI